MQVPSPNTDLRTDLLERLEKYEERTLALWQELFRKGNLWDSLSKHVAEKRLNKNVARWFDECLAGIAGLPNDDKRADIGQWMATAAVEAAGLGGPSAYMGANPWYRDSVRSFDRSLLLSRWSSASVPVAGASLDVPPSEILRFELDVLAGGTGIVRHPRDDLSIYLSSIEDMTFGKTCAIRDPRDPRVRDSSGFVVSLYRAFETARRLAGEPSDCQGRWSFVHADGEPARLDQVDGSSASGAALLGWYRCLTNTTYDPRIIVIAAVENLEVPLLTPVDNGGIARKIEAILTANREAKREVDTIGVLPENADAAREALALAGHSDIRVVELDREIKVPAGASRK